jgi:hypothetical protein
MALRPVPVDKRSPFLGEDCALCKQPFAPGDEIAVCPEDATRHHVHCWRAYGNKCTAYGCTGRGEVIGATTADADAVRSPRQQQNETPKIQTLPARSFHCAQSCLVLAIALSIVLFAIGCFGLWAIADYVAIEIMDWQYRGALVGIQPVAGWLNLLITIATTGSYAWFAG